MPRCSAFSSWCCCSGRRACSAARKSKKSEFNKPELEGGNVMTKRNILMSAAAGTLLSLLASAASADITIAVVGPMTGQNAAFGEQFRRGAEAAVADLNAAG